MFELNRDQLEALIGTHYDQDVYDTPEQRSFAMLVDVAALTYTQYLEADRPTDEDPDSFVPSTMGGVSHGWALIEGLIENLEMRFPEGNFRDMGVTRKNN